ncbi:MAG TPA: ribosome-associated translation inhibitor RaiA [Stellaceae bacterium]|nr:ribosome-associated translation inhibitor RaiA [Stellaceae bacterium]
MHVTVTGRQIDVGDSLRGHVETATTAIVEKYFGKAIEAHVVFYRERHLISSDVSVHAGRGMLVQCHGSSADAYAAFDSAADRLDKQLRRYKRRLRNRHKGARESNGEDAQGATDYVLAPIADDSADEATGDQPLVIAELRTSIPQLSVSEAVMRLDLADLSAMLFRNSARGSLNLVYRRRDGNVGWIDPDLDAQGGQATPDKGS